MYEFEENEDGFRKHWEDLEVKALQAAGRHEHSWLSANQRLRFLL
jgi:hypothetical protein